MITKSDLKALSALIAPEDSNSALPVWLLRESDLNDWKGGPGLAWGQWLFQNGFKGERQQLLVLPALTENGLNAGTKLCTIAGAVLGIGQITSLDKVNLWHVAGLSQRLPPGDWYFADKLAPLAASQALLGWLIGGYRFSSMRTGLTLSVETPQARLVCPVGSAASLTQALAVSCAYTRDLINMPMNYLGPAELADSANTLAAEFGAQFSEIVGEKLLYKNYPLIHAVGRASSSSPRLIDIRWGDPTHPKVTLVGKGVCFDTGGLDLKNSNSMLLMKKDMSGAAIALGLARVLMQRQAGIRLRVLIPAVENSIGGNAFRPSDVLPSRLGLNIEVGNTDAEGRLVLADALAEADREKPDLLIDFATLTGAARVALGPELPAAFSNDNFLLTQVHKIGEAVCDPVWPMPLWDSYDEDLSSRVADLNNVASSSFAGSIYGALFLRRFVSHSTSWIHFDLYGWNSRERPGRPIGAEAQCLRLVDQLIRERFTK